MSRAVKDLIASRARQQPLPPSKVFPPAEDLHPRSATMRQTAAGGVPVAGTTEQYVGLLKKKLDEQRSELENRTDAINSVQRNFESLSSMYSDERGNARKATGRIASLEAELAELKKRLSSDYVPRPAHTSVSDRCDVLEQLVADGTANGEALAARVDALSRDLACAREEAEESREKAARVSAAAEREHGEHCALAHAAEDWLKRLVDQLAVFRDDLLLRAAGGGAAGDAGKVDAAVPLPGTRRDTNDAAELQTALPLSSRLLGVCHTLEFLDKKSTPLLLGAAADAIGGLRRELAQRDSALADARERGGRGQAAVDDLKAELLALRKQIEQEQGVSADLQREARKAAAAAAKADGGAKAAAARAAAAEADAARLQARLAEGARAGGSALEAAAAERDAALAEKDAVLAEKDELSAEAAALRAALERAEEKAREGDGALRSRKSDAEAEAAGWRSAKAAWEGERRRLADELDRERRGAELALGEEQRAREQLAETIRNLTRAVEGLRGEVQAAERKAAALPALEAELRTLRSQLESARAQIDEFTSAADLQTRALEAAATRHSEALAAAEAAAARAAAEARRLEARAGAAEAGADSWKARFDAGQQKLAAAQAEAAGGGAALLEARRSQQDAAALVAATRKQLAEAEAARESAEAAVQATRKQADDVQLALAALQEIQSATARTIQKLLTSEEASESSFACLSCLNIMRGPTLCSPCGHMYCERCIQSTCADCGQDVEATIPSPAFELLVGRYTYRKQVLRDLGTTLEAATERRQSMAA